jgi:hypothetical protein
MAFTEYMDGLDDAQFAMLHALCTAIQLGHQQNYIPSYKQQHQQQMRSPIKEGKQQQMGLPVSTCNVSRIQYILIYYLFIKLTKI